MSKEDKINKIYSYCVVLLIHLIKQQEEKRTTHSWNVSIRNSIDAINRINKRRKAGEFYMNKKDLEETLAEAYGRALDNAALEAFGGIYDGLTLSNLVKQKLILKEALDLILKSVNFSIIP